MNDSIDKKRLRKIRSFVRREGRLTKGQQRALDTLFPIYGLLPSEHEVLNFIDIFGNDHPVHLEIGFGNGQTLIQMAVDRPEVNFVGIEVHRPGVGNALLQIEDQSIKNVRVICQDAVEVINNHIPDQSLSVVYIFFPDPWHKKRHHKRRLVTAEFIERLTPKMQNNAVLQMATDWEDYAQQMMAVMQEVTGFVNTAGEGNYSDRPDYRPVTKFEQRGMKLGHGTWDLIFRKC